MTVRNKAFKVFFVAVFWSCSWYGSSSLFSMWSAACLCFLHIVVNISLRRPENTTISVWETWEHLDAWEHVKPTNNVFSIYCTRQRLTSSCFTDGRHVAGMDTFSWVCVVVGGRGVLGTTSQRSNPQPSLALLACFDWWMGSLAWLISVEQAIRTPGPCEIIPSSTGTRLSVVLRALELSSLSLYLMRVTLVLCPASFFLCTHTHHSEVTEATCDTGSRGGGLAYVSEMCALDGSEQRLHGRITRLNGGCGVHSGGFSINHRAG